MNYYLNTKNIDSISVHHDELLVEILYNSGHIDGLVMNDKQQLNEIENIISGKSGLNFIKDVKGK